MITLANEVWHIESNTNSLFHPTLLSCDHLFPNGLLFLKEDLFREHNLSLTALVCPSSRVGVLDLVYTPVSTCIYDANLNIPRFEPKRLTALKLCMKRHLVDVNKFCTQDTPGLITGPVQGVRHLYVGICRPIIRKFSG